ncbi:MAG: hypothetical protein Q8N61_02025, partial [bacterium]|nr:hypothetical protein [bacterium]
VAADQIYDIFFGFDMGNTYKIVNVPITNLASIFTHNRSTPFAFYYFKQFPLQQQADWSQ